MKNSVRRKVLGIVGAVFIAVFGLVAAMPVPDAAAVSEAKTVADAKKACKKMLGDNYKSKYWKVSGSNKNKQTGKCSNIKKSKKDTCTSYGGKAGTVENGKFTCTWSKKLKESSGSGSGDSNNSNSGSGNCVKTSILGGGEYCDDGEGGGVYQILLIIFNILSAGVGVLGVVGLVISGLTYLTARDNEQQVAKAKSRILQIVIGLAIYAVMFTALQWLIPGGIFGS